MFYNYHTHILEKNANISLTQAQLTDAPEGCGFHYNLQLHPWDLPPEFLGLPEGFSELAASEKVEALGEIGLDKCHGAPFEVQRKYFSELLKLASVLHKPVVLHIVKAWNEAEVELSKYPKLQIIYHGFRGKVEYLRQLLNYGCFVSMHFSMLEDDAVMDFIKRNPEIQCRIGLESDDKTLNINVLYQKYYERLNE